MNLSQQLLLIWWSFVAYFILMRAFYFGVKRYQLNTSAYKKRKKGENFIEWLFYLRYKEEIPKRLLIPYYFMLAVHLVANIACIFIHTANLSPAIGNEISILTSTLEGTHMIVINLLYWSPKRGYVYDRWIVKKRGQKPKNKKK